MNARKIFVGSSSEGWKAAEAVAKVIQGAGMEPVLWKNVFPAGDILLDKIEQLPNLVDGAILVATPDLTCNREKNNDTFSAPVPNIIFEYAYLSARLSRKRVAICMFEGVELPSDLQGLTVVLAGNQISDNRISLPRAAKENLQHWLAGLVPLAAGIAPIYQVHGYSGTWNVQNRFSLWHGIELRENDRVSFDGKTYLYIRQDGEEGYGNQVGRLNVRVDQYSATWDIANRIFSAVVDREGCLTLRFTSQIRRFVEDRGVLPSDHVREELPSPEWEVVLTPNPDKPKVLTGVHTFQVAQVDYSTATETFTYLGL